MTIKQEDTGREANPNEEVAPSQIMAQCPANDNVEQIGQNDLVSADPVPLMDAVLIVNDPSTAGIPPKVWINENPEELLEQNELVSPDVAEVVTDSVPEVKAALSVEKPSATAIAPMDPQEIARMIIAMLDPKPDTVSIASVPVEEGALIGDKPSDIDLATLQPSEIAPMIDAFCEHNRSAVEDIVSIESDEASEDKHSGYNSSDEHCQSTNGEISSNEWDRRADEFDEMMAQHGLKVLKMCSDGACLFRAVSVQIYGDENLHYKVRKRTMDYIQQNRHKFQHFITENFYEYVERKRAAGTHGNHVEIQAIHEIYNRTIEIYSYSATPMYVWKAEEPRPDVPPVRLSYECNCHYNAIVPRNNDSMDFNMDVTVSVPVDGTDTSKEQCENVTIDVSTELTSDPHGVEARQEKANDLGITLAVEPNSIDHCKELTNQPADCEQQEEQAKSKKSVKTVPKSSKGKRGRPRRTVSLNIDPRKRQAPQDDTCPPTKRCKYSDQSCQTIKSSFNRKNNKYKRRRLYQNLLKSLCSIDGLERNIRMCIQDYLDQHEDEDQDQDPEPENSQDL
ncbi:uncharacterized protein LOC111519749 isoform X2 [Drosophila willistoni]|uniref:uncharacterized protein LOC111519749 isoform X2 n=1 Tax=Drosophila willistoni TaxID=7260 RepID=UPI000C26CD45|nr:uncharacterized protein LOC111519749 isoform X2 [Drosophila willistoni]